ncbi:MAG TPA: iron uptake transporter permease EfeU [Actinomycetota bacterium]|nr:iron uptake transporter permease EfeU [Actinomycetota bacterium]
MLPTFVIGLREGVEAALIIGIIAAFLIQRDERSALRWMWVGVGLAIGLCLGIAATFRAINQSLPHKQQETLEALMALLAVGGVTYMIIWMRRHSRGLKHVLESHAETALVQGSTWALVGLAFFAVIREGLETSVFLIAAFQNSLNPRATGTGAVLGILLAAVLGYGIYKGGVRINLSRFFRVTGFILVLVAAGLLASAAHAAAEAGFLTIGQASALNLTWLIAPGTIRASLITGMLGLQPSPTVIEVSLWLVYAIAMGLYVLWPHGRAPQQRRAANVEPSPTAV